jgi:hypothetical protein
MSSTNTYLSNVLSGAVTELRAKSRLRIYQDDPQAWLSDVLGKRWYSKQAEIVEIPLCRHLAPQ